MNPSSRASSRASRGELPLVLVKVLCGTGELPLVLARRNEMIPCTSIVLCGSGELPLVLV